MSGGILSVVTDTLEKLAGKQNSSATDIKNATNTVKGIGATVKQTHGSYTDNFNDALATFETTRNTAGTGLEGVATQLAQNLIGAVKSYINTDLFGAGALDKQVNI